jgi:hypothetical protein
MLEEKLEEAIVAEFKRQAANGDREVFRGKPAFSQQAGPGTEIAAERSPQNGWT